ncbi:lysophospholipase L1-like esterase [Roseimicrobium gellanilyticum]|uniref:Lysophospholipase L1-like esterase n=1 Tax=Roseimicrobium gellanilyticum TaxID=748857 RepID=A0A366H5A6_9BACT|nr:GDSL-type esterase/lipase family protein [Roseimicrobium gellanilyticum]RBP36057.1 lysophospholipase L1-like esterase [Roseimicrobium gellanilyticum]
MRASSLLILPFLAVLASFSPVRADEKAQSTNTAIIPVGKLEKDFYEWDQRHAAVMAVKDQLKPEVVLIGDSITHFWGGQPNEPKGNRGAQAWKDLFGDRPVLNLGFGWDRTQNVLKRIELGELDGLAPKAVVIHIGTNNLAGTKNARENTPDEIVEGIALIVQRVQEKCPAAKVIVMAVFPRGEKPDNTRRVQVNAINERLAKKMEGTKGVTYLDITAKLTNPDGTISKEMMPDFLHPGAKGYAIWAEALNPVLPK